MPNILFYDGQCALCSHEIKWLERWKDSDLELTDIHTPRCEDLAAGIDKTTLLTILHLKRSDESWALGLDATVSAWQHTPFGFLLKPLRWPLIAPIADWFYLRWAKKRASSRICKLPYNDASHRSESK